MELDGGGLELLAILLGGSSVLLRAAWQDTSGRPWHSSGCNVALVVSVLVVTGLGAYFVLFFVLAGS